MIYENVCPSVLDGCEGSAGLSVLTLAQGRMGKSTSQSSRAPATRESESAD